MIGLPFILGPLERELLHRLRELAAKHPVDMPPLRERLKTRRGKREHMKRMTAQTVFLPFGFAATLSIETNHPGGRTARHMSMSSPVEGRLPIPEAVWMVAVELGFTGSLEDDCFVWIEKLRQGDAVNVVQLLATPGTEKVQ